MSRKVWGIDSVTAVTEPLCSCVLSNFGSVKYWGEIFIRRTYVLVGLT